jgi:hypothetical protein
MTTTSTPPGDAELKLALAVEAAFGPLLGDVDVGEVGAVEGGLVELVRHGRRERLQVLAQGALFSLLRERGAEVDVVHARLPGGHKLVAAPLADGRVAVAVHKPVPADVRFERLVQEGLLPPGVDAELVAAVLQGKGIAVVGPSRSGRARLAAAVARAVAATVRCTSLCDDVPAGCTPAPGIPHLVARARTAVALGADVVVAVELSVREAADLAANTPGAPLVASVAAPSVDVVVAAVGEKAWAALCPLCAVVGFSPDGRARLLELHGGGDGDDDGDTAAAAPPPGAAPTLVTTAATPTLPSSSPPSRTRAASEPAPPATSDETAVSLGEAPPADWASADADDDPGWELGSLASGNASLPPSSSTSFDAALSAAAKRPSFSPRAPSAHPAMHALRGTGGLTFEPPSGPDVDDDGER